MRFRLVGYDVFVGLFLYRRFRFVGGDYGYVVFGFSRVRRRYRFVDGVVGRSYSYAVRLVSFVFVVGGYFVRYRLRVDFLYVGFFRIG